MAPPKIKVTGVGSIPSGYLLGRSSPGHGDVELIAAPELQRGGSVGSSSGGCDCECWLLTGEGEPAFVGDGEGNIIEIDCD